MPSGDLVRDVAIHDTLRTLHTLVLTCRHAALRRAAPTSPTSGVQRLLGLQQHSGQLRHHMEQDDCQVSHSLHGGNHGIGGSPLDASSSRLTTRAGGSNWVRSPQVANAAPAVPHAARSPAPSLPLFTSRSWQVQIGPLAVEQVSTIDSCVDVSHEWVYYTGLLIISSAWGAMSRGVPRQRMSRLPKWHGWVRAREGGQSGQCLVREWHMEATTVVPRPFRDRPRPSTPPPHLTVPPSPCPPPHCVLCCTAGHHDQHF